MGKSSFNACVLIKPGTPYRISLDRVKIMHIYLPSEGYDIDSLNNFSQACSTYEYSPK